MKQVRKSVLLWYSPREMYDLVTDVTSYPIFLPWCDSALLVARHDDGVTARLGLAYMGVRHQFTTRSRQVPGESVKLDLVDGPFSLLDGLWQFRPVGQVGQGGQVAESSLAACKIELDLRYGFSSTALEGVISPVFDKVARTLVDSFVKRAESVYGPR
jgi:ribosome-associated toxin RatA of RatAB toxin-antitoxin module